MRHFAIATALVAASACSRYEVRPPPLPRPAVLEVVKIQDGRYPGDVDVVVRIQGLSEGHGENPYRVYRLPAKSELWIDIEHTSLPPGELPVHFAAGSGRHVHSVRAQQFPGGLLRVIVALVDPRATKASHVFTGRMTNALVVTLSDADPSNAILSPQIERDLRRGGRMHAALAHASAPPSRIEPWEKKALALEAQDVAARLAPGEAFMRAVPGAKVVVLARAEAHELALIDALSPDIAIGPAAGFAAGGRVTWRVEKVIRGQAPELLVLDVPVCRPVEPGTDCLSVDELRMLTKRLVVVLLDANGALAGMTAESIFPADRAAIDALREIE